MDAQREQLEAQIRQAWSAGDFPGATTHALRGYGPEVLGFLFATQRGVDLAEQAFSLFAEHLWQGMPRFEWKSSVRTWSYVLARHASIDVLRGEARHQRGRAPFDADPVAEVAAVVRTATLSLLRTEPRDAFARLRDELPEEDRLLLILRVDRELDWREIASVLGSASEGTSESDAQIARESARLRKRFQLLKERLRALGKQRGLTGA